MPVLSERSNIKHEANLAPEFTDEIAKTPGCENIRHCIQCGTCSSACPMSPYMDYTPRQIIARTRAGFKDDVLRCQSIWLCASCYACTVACPKGIKITDVMYALKRRAIEESVFPSRFPIAVLAKEFSKVVYESGRNTEGPLIVRLAMKTHPLAMLKQAKLGFNLFRKGRFGMKREGIKRPAELRQILDALNGSGGS